jgi:hypothetical protein
LPGHLARGVARVAPHLIAVTAGSLASRPGRPGHRQPRPRASRGPRRGRGQLPGREQPPGHDCLTVKRRKKKRLPRPVRGSRFMR